MTSQCASLHQFPALRDTGQTAGRMDLVHAGAEIHRPDFESNVSQAFQLLALKWLDDLFARYEKVTATCGRNRITVPPVSPQGFAVTLSIEGGRCRVLIGPCCEDFGSVAEATDYMTAAIRGDLRLRVDLDQRPHRWAVERRLPNGSWLDDAAAETWLRPYQYATGNSWYFRNQPKPEN